MASGSRGSPDIPRARLGAGTIVAALLAISVLLCLSSCAGRGDIGGSLAAIDALLASPPSADLARAFDRAFAAAYRAAGSGAAASSSDWLSVLKRARAAEKAGDSGRYMKAAGRAIAAAPRSEPVAAAAAHALIRGGRPSEALALFDGTLNPDSRPSLWAESLFAAWREGGLGPERMRSSDFGRLAEILGDRSLYRDAAVLALRERGQEAAALWARRALSAGAELPAALAWDCGLIDHLASRPDAGASPAALALYGDAAWRLGDGVLARERWERALALDPRASWKPYAKLARLSSSDPEARASWWERMRAAFLAGPPGSGDPAAAAALARELLARGSAREAVSLLEPYAADSSAGLVYLAARGRSWPEERLVAEAERFAAERPRDGAALAGVLRLLAERGRLADLSLLRAAGERAGLDYRYSWFYKAMTLAAAGELGASAAILEKDGPAESGPEAAFALGVVYRALGSPSRAAERLEVAAASARGPAERCAAFKELGKALAEAGDAAKADAAYRAARASDPEDPEAALLSRGARLP